ncbi:hypothetical protein [Streptomyces sp. NPDC059411]|uniref:hypothetical protein n=1 Tax=Streptomyces sp. NPDC059411 TaxID=3346825 RepID=UPI0036D09CA6
MTSAQKPDGASSRCLIPLKPPPYGGDSRWHKTQWDDYRFLLKSVGGRSGDFGVGTVRGTAESILSIAEEDIDVATCQQARAGLIDAVASWAEAGEGDERKAVAEEAVSAIRDVFQQHDQCFAAG